MVSDWAKEAVAIILTLGGLEFVIWQVTRWENEADREEWKKQTELLEKIADSMEALELDTVDKKEEQIELLEDIAVTLSVREMDRQ